MPKQKNAALGRRIAAAREQAGMTQAKLAAGIGVTAGAVAQYETGRTRPALPRLEAIASTLGRSTDWLLTGADRAQAANDSSPVARRNKKPRAGDRKAVVGMRLRWVRELIDENRTRLAGRYGIDHTAWNKWEKGETYPDPDVMARFCDDWGVTMDWLYRGRVRTVMDEELKKRLIALHPKIITDRQG